MIRSLTEEEVRILQAILTREVLVTQRRQESPRFCLSQRRREGERGRAYQTVLGLLEDPDGLKTVAPKIPDLGPLDRALP